MRAAFTLSQAPHSQNDSESDINESTSKAMWEWNFIGAFEGIQIVEDTRFVQFKSHIKGMSQAEDDFVAIDKLQLPPKSKSNKLQQPP